MPHTISFYIRRNAEKLFCELLTGHEYEKTINNISKGMYVDNLVTGVDKEDKVKNLK